MRKDKRFSSKKEDFAHVLQDYDAVLNSLDKVTLEKSLRVLKPGGQLISISGPPDAAFARSIGASWALRVIMGFLSYGIRAKAKRRQLHYSFPLHIDQGGHGLRRSRTRKGQGRRLAAVR